MYIFEQFNIANINRWQKMTTPSSSSENQLSDYVKKFVPSCPETGTKLHKIYCFLAQSRAAIHRPNGEHLLGTFCTNKFDELHVSFFELRPHLQ
jgi:hypothetical protein